ncbi:MAG TPA: POTRA domain-containing protein [Polyangiaceae bacterium]|nr:POTRA domain-containing protein [Polyangiaceae bacterium]
MPTLDHRFALATGLFVLATTACNSIPRGRSAVDDIDVEGADEVGEKDILKKMATAKSKRFLGVFEGIVYEYEVFNRFVLERDLARIERYYRARGFYEATVRAGRIHRISKDEVRVDIIVDEGPLVRIGDITLKGLHGLDAALVENLWKDVRYALPRDDPFEEKAFAAAEKRLEKALTDAGYAWAEVSRKALVDLVKHQAQIELTIEAGNKATFGDLVFQGLGEIPEDKVRAAMDIEPGDPYSTKTLEDAHDAAVDLGVFSSIRLEPQLQYDAKKRVVPIVVRLSQGALRSVKLGGGATIDAIKSDVHLRTGWESRNFLGGLRHLSVEARPGVVLYPLRINNWVAPQRVLPHLELLNRLEQPGLFEPRTTGYIEPNARLFPVLLKTDPKPEDPILGYAALDGEIGLERRFWKVFGEVSAHVEYAQPFAYAGRIDPFVKPVLITYPELALRFDHRDDKIHPSKGVLASTAVQTGLFTDAQDVRVIPELSGYVPLGVRYLVLVTRTRVGLLFPRNYGRSIPSLLHSPTGATTQEEVRDVQIMYFRGLFGGGNGSNRGYPPRTISPHAPVPFLSAETEAAKIQQGCQEGDPDFDPSLCSVPIGGRTLWELSIELRYPIMPPLLGAVFCDAADVAPGEVEFRPDHPHLSCGTGLRYDTPVGAIRLDVAYRIPGVQVLDENHSPREEGDPGTIFGAPINIGLGIGEAF